MNKWIALLLCCLAALAGCGGGDDGDSATTQQQESTGGTGGAAAGATVKVRMKNIQFVPDAVTVKAGDTVRWTNADSVTHTVTKKRGPGDRFDSGNVKVGASFEVTFDKPGKVKYVCTIHPNQTGTVNVE